MDFETDLFLESLPALLGGAWLTVQLTVVSVSLGLMIGVLGGLARVSDHKFLNIPALVYVTIMRGVPMLVTILFLYYGMPSIGFVWDPFLVAVIALAATNGAYVTEIVRSGIQGVDRGQMRAARSLGMSYPLAMRRIILPQALRRVLPPITNESITLLKNTALVSVIALSDLLRVGLEIMTWKANTFSPFAGVALIYLCLTLPLVALNTYLERSYRIQ
jgi:His/Glu/Gln/Arg/opine family amino acid ABC transporter permease subunit